MNIVYNKNSSSPVGYTEYMGAQRGPKELEMPRGVKQISQEKEAAIKLTQNLTTLVEDIIKRLTEYHKAYIANTAEADLTQFYPEWGPSILHHYHLGENKELLKATGTAHPEDAVEVIIKAVWEALQASERKRQ